jgi:hypothetical protein
VFDKYTRSLYHTIAQGITGALVAGIGGNGGGAIAAAAVGPLTSRAIGQLTVGNTAANIAAHAVEGAVLGSLTSGNAVAGAIGEGGSAAMASGLSTVLYNTNDTSKLKENEKQNLSAAMQIATGLAAGTVGALSGGDSASTAMAQGAESGKNEVENNWLSPKEWLEYIQAVKDGNKEKQAELMARSAARDQQLDDDCGNKSTQGACSKDKNDAHNNANNIYTWHIPGAGDHTVAINPQYEYIPDDPIKNFVNKVFYDGSKQTPQLQLLIDPEQAAREQASVTYQNSMDYRLATEVGTPVLTVMGLWDGVGLAANGIGLIKAANSGNRLISVTSWAEKGITPDLNVGRWVILGNPTKVNFAKTGLFGPKVYFSPFRYESSNVPFNNFITGKIPANTLKWSEGWEKIKGVLGQRVIQSKE